MIHLVLGKQLNKKEKENNLVLKIAKINIGKNSKNELH